MSLAQKSITSHCIRQFTSCPFCDVAALHFTAKRTAHKLRLNEALDLNGTGSTSNFVHIMKSNLPTTHILNTKRCRLRYPNKNDIPHIWSASRYEGFNDGMVWNAPENISELKEPLENAMAQWSERTNFTWTVENIETGTFIGRCAIRLHDPKNDIWSIGYWVHPKQQSNGYASESIKALLSLGFNTLNAQSIVASHAKWNKVSGKVLTKNGMKYIGDTEQGFQKNGEWVAEHDYSISRKEFFQ